MNVLVIGGTGFIGRHVVARLAAQGHEVTVLHRGRTESTLPAGVRELLGDRNALPERRGELRKLRPDVVVDMVLSNGSQARQLMDVLRGAAARVVAASSQDVYRACAVMHGLEPGPLQPVPLTEDSPLRTRLNPYPPPVIARLRQVLTWVEGEYDKIPAEHAVMGDPALPGTVLRLPMVYGPGDPLHRLHPILKRIGDGRPAVPLHEHMAQWRCTRGYVEDVAAAIALAAVRDEAKGRVYNVGEPVSFSEEEWTRAVCRQADYDGEVVVLPGRLAPAHLRPPGNPAQHWTTSTERIRRELGFTELVAREAALARSVAWERAHPQEPAEPALFDYAAEDAALQALDAERRCLDRP